MGYLRRFKRLPNRLKATFLILICVVILGIGTFIWAALSGKLSPQAEGETASFYLSYEPMVQVGNVFSVDIYINTQLGANKIAVNSLHYNPNLLEISDSNPAEGVQIIEYQLEGMTVTQNTVDINNGIITYILQGNNTTFQGQARIATVRFKALAVGNAQFNFDFDPTDPIKIGDCDVIIPIENTEVDILKYASSSSLIISAVSTPTSGTTSDTGGTINQTHKICFEPKKVCLTVNGPGDNQCSTYADCLVTPTPEITPELTPTPVEETPITENTNNEISQVINPTPTPMPTPTPIISISPTLLYPDTANPSPVIEIAGYGISKTMSLILFIVGPLLITFIIYLIWYYTKNKKNNLISSDKKNDNDDEII